MIDGAEPFVHVLLFECRNCKEPIVSALTTHDESIEQIDARTLALHCKACSSLDSFMGTEAKRHWVDTWN